MKNLFIAIIALTIVSCSSGPSLETYFIDNQEKNEFTGIDIPVGLLKMNAGELSSDMKETLNSVHKISLLGLEHKKDNANQISEEKSKLQSIFSNPKYKELTRFKDKGVSAKIYYVGEQDAIDEVVIFGSDKTKGVGVVRVLGKDMDLAKIMSAVNDLRKNGNAQDMSALKDIFKSF